MDPVHRTGISRRISLAGLGASGLGPALFARAFGVNAQDATPTTGPIKGNQLAPGDAPPTDDRHGVPIERPPVEPSEQPDTPLPVG